MITIVLLLTRQLIIKPSFTKVEYESPAFLERIQGDICGPMHLPSGHFCYFMVLIDASTHWSLVCLIQLEILPSLGYLLK